jgi:hypothetical protein
MASVTASLSPRKHRSGGAGQDTNDGNEREREKHERPDAEPNPQRGTNAEEGTRRESKRGDDELEEEDGEGELLEIVPGRVRLRAPLVGAYR